MWQINSSVRLLLSSGSECNNCFYNLEVSLKCGSAIVYSPKMFLLQNSGSLQADTWYLRSLHLFKLQLHRNPLAWGFLSFINWWMIAFACRKCCFISNLFNLFQSNYQPRCLWLVDYLCLASLAASPDRQAAISHFTMWAQPSRMRFLPLWGPLCSLGGIDRKASYSPSLVPRELIWP